MTRYAIRRRLRARTVRADDDDDMCDARQPLPTIVVNEPADDFVDTGLVDASGEAIVRMREPIGFVTS